MLFVHHHDLVKPTVQWPREKEQKDNDLYIENQRLSKAKHAKPGVNSFVLKS
jgi:hypothetical protein